MGPFPSFSEKVKAGGLSLNRRQVKTLQINIGKLCNLSCRHCHVESGPNKKRENMDQSTAERIVELLAASPTIKEVDLTGGAPELNPNFRYLVKESKKLGKAVIDRCNLTVLLKDGQEDTAEFLADHKVRIIASLPCYSRENVEKQRGEGVFSESIDVLRSLNAMGYGRDPSLVLDLVYNPGGASLPPDQASLELTYKTQLAEDFDISFNRLFTITNMPIKRFMFDLKRSGHLGDYMQLLVNSYNHAAAANIMCRELISISWDGKIFDCDFNQALGLSIAKQQTLWNIKSFEATIDQPIATASHCFGCTAGAGSSCGGAVAKA